jgi:hypothetical protein
MPKRQVYSSKKHDTSQKNSQHSTSKEMHNELKKDLKKMGKSFFAGFDSFPKALKFESQESQEEIILFLRRHFVINLPWIFIAILLAIFPLLFSSLGFFSFLPDRFGFMTYLLWYIFILVYILEKFLSWLYNVYIVTDERIIDVDFHSLIYKKISETKIDKIEDVTYVQGGFVESFFNYGTVFIQTAAEKREFEFEHVTQPARVAKVLNQLILQEEQEKIEGRVR